MTVLFMEGFDGLSSTADLARKWRGATVGISGTNGLRSGYHASIGSGSVSILDCAIGSAKGTLCVGFALRVESSDTVDRPLVRFRDGATTDQCGVWVTPDRRLAFYRGATQVATSAPVVTLNTWGYFEFKVVFGDSGSYLVKYAGVDVLSATGVDTTATANPTADTVYFGLNANTYFTWRFDDMYVDDADLLGEVRIDTIKPTSDGAYQEWTPSTAGAHWSLVDEVSPLSQSDQVSAASVGLRDTYGLSDVSVLALPVAAVQVSATMASDGTRSGGVMIRSGSVDAASAGVSLSPTWKMPISTWTVDPATGAAFTEAGVNALEAGVLVTA